MNPPAESDHDLFLNVRRACRLLHGYQTMVRDAIRYIMTQFDIPYHDIRARFAEDAKAGVRYLNQSAWDHLPVMFEEYLFVKTLAEGSWFGLSFFVVSDTGFLQGEADSKEEVARFAPAEESTTRLAVILHRSHWEHFYFMEDKAQMRDFLKPDGTLPESVLQQTDKEFVSRSYDMAFLTSEEEANKIVRDLVEIAKTHSFPLALKKVPSPA